MRFPAPQILRSKICEVRSPFRRSDPLARIVSPEAAAPATEPEQTPTQTETPEPEQVSENLTGKQDYGRAQQLQQTTPVLARTNFAEQNLRGLADSGTPFVKGDIAKDRAATQDRKREKTDKIMAVLEGKGPPTLKLRRVNAITNDEVEKLLHVSDATATRYLDMLEKEGRLRQEGKAGKYVVYVKME